MKTYITAWFLVLLAIALWGGYAFFAYTIITERNEYSLEKGAARAAEEEDHVESRLRALLRDSQQERAALDTFTAVDVVSAASLIEEAGKVSRVTAEIQGATAAPPIDPAIAVRAVVINVGVSGTLTLIHEFIALIEKAPFASFIESVDLRPSEIAATRWEGAIHIKIITTSAIGV